MTSEPTTSQSSRLASKLEPERELGDSTEASLQKLPLTTDQGDHSTANGFWGVFFSTFLTIFLAELGDKTQVTTMLMSAESQSPWVVFAGAGLALVATSLIGVLLGQWLSKRVSEESLDTWAGILLLLITIGLVGDIVGS